MELWWSRPRDCSSVLILKQSTETNQLGTTAPNTWVETEPDYERTPHKCSITAVYQPEEVNKQARKCQQTARVKSDICGFDGRSQ